MFPQIRPVVKNLIIINALLFLASQTIPLINQYFTGYYYLSPNFRPWQIVTHMFMHGNLMHIFFNMYALYLFGNILEAQWGARRFLTYYMLCGLGAFFLHELVIHLEVTQLRHQVSDSELAMVLSRGYEVLMQGKNFVDENMANLNIRINTGVVGASGAVFGILLAFGMLFPNTELFLMFIPVPIKARWFVLGYGAIELLMALRNSPGDSVAHYAHLGGMLVGYIILKIWQRRRDAFY